MLLPSPTVHLNLGRAFTFLWRTWARLWLTFVHWSRRSDAIRAAEIYAAVSLLLLIFLVALSAYFLLCVMAHIARPIEQAHNRL